MIDVDNIVDLSTHVGETQRTAILAVFLLRNLVDIVKTSREMAFVTENMHWARREFFHAMIIAILTNKLWLPGRTT